MAGFALACTESPDPSLSRTWPIRTFISDHLACRSHQKFEAKRAKARLEEDVEAGDRVLDPDRCKLNDLQDGRFLCIFLFDACERGGTLKRMLRRAVRSSSST